MVKTEEREYRAKAVIVTAGGSPNKLGVPGEEELNARGVSYCAVCDGPFFNGQVLGVVGGGDAAVEEAGYLTKYASKVYLIHRRNELRAQKILQERLFANEKVEVIWDTVVEEIRRARTARSPPCSPAQRQDRRDPHPAPSGALHLHRLQAQHGHAGPAQATASSATAAGTS